jgi:hypothetical protein
MGVPKAGGRGQGSGVRRQKAEKDKTKDQGRQECLPHNDVS